MSRYYPKGRALFYVQAERNWALVLSVWGVLSTVAGVSGFFFRPLLLVEGMSMPFFLIGLSLLVIGVRQLTWALRQGMIVEAHPAHLPKHFLQEEWERVAVLLPLLERGRELSLLFFIFGLSLALLARILEWGLFSLGVGTGLVIQSAFAVIYLLLYYWTKFILDTERTEIFHRAHRVKYLIISSLCALCLLRVLCVIKNVQ